MSNASRDKRTVGLDQTIPRGLFRPIAYAISMPELSNLVIYADFRPRGLGTRRHSLTATSTTITTIWVRIIAVSNAVIYLFSPIQELVRHLKPSLIWFHLIYARQHQDIEKALSKYAAEIRRTQISIACCLNSWVRSNDGSHISLGLWNLIASHARL
jgi:hypothetical protein